MAAQKVFDLEERILILSKNAITFAKTLKLEIIISELILQFIRSITSIGANYKEANDALGRKDFLMRIRTSRKEAKEAHYWLELILHTYPNCDKLVYELLRETTELTKIFSKIIEKSS